MADKTKMGFEEKLVVRDYLKVNAESMHGKTVAQVHPIVMVATGFTFTTGVMRHILDDCRKSGSVDIRIKQRYSTGGLKAQVLDLIQRLSDLEDIVLIQREEIRQLKG